MAEQLIIEWGHSELAGLAADVSGESVRIHRAFHLVWPDDSDHHANAEQAGAWLRDRLRGVGVRSRGVRVLLPRDAAVVRRLDVPDVPEQELPDLVRFQAETKLSTSLDQSVLDFVPLPLTEGAETRQVMMVTVPRETLEEIQTVTQSAGLELKSVGLVPIATAELIANWEAQQELDSDGTVLVVAVREQQADILLMRRQQVLLMHSAPLASDDRETKVRPIPAEIRRSLGALARSDGDVQVDRVWIIGSLDEYEQLSPALARQLNCEVGRVDPAEMEGLRIDSRAGFSGSGCSAALLGMLRSTTEPLVSTVDFLNPRQPIVRVDRRKRKAALIAAGILLIASATYGGMRWRVSGLEREIHDKQEQLTRLKQAIKKGQPTRRAAGILDDWIRRDVNGLDVLVDVNRLLPGTDRVLLVEYRLSPASGASVARVRATGFARDRRDVEQLYQRLAERRYLVQPHEISRTSKDVDYPYRFQLDLGLAARNEVPDRNNSAHVTASHARRGGPALPQN